MKTNKPLPIILEREQSALVFEAARAHGYTDLQARILSGRLAPEAVNDLPRLVSPSLADLDGPESLPDIDRAAERIAQAVRTKQNIITISDYDADGVTGCMVLTVALRDVFNHPIDRIHYFIGHRMKDGYGVSDTLTDRVIASGLAPAVVCTIDQGSNDHERIERLAKAQYVVIVSDHHQMGEPPKSAFACVSPARTDSQFPDPHIPGAHVAWLICCAVRQRLIDTGDLPTSTPRLGYLLDVVSAATIADCTSLGRSKNNRAVVQHGLKMMNLRPRPAWTAIREEVGTIDTFDESTLGYTICPMINAASRVSDVKPALDLLLAPDVNEARVHAKHLHELNIERRAIEARLRVQALDIAWEQVAEGRSGLVVVLEDGHVGVQGITASRVVCATGKPTVCLSPKPGTPGMFSGSIRSVPGIDARQVLADIHETAPGLQAHWGGHAMACGTGLMSENIEQFSKAFDDGVRRQMTGPLVPRVWTDGKVQSPGLAHLNEIAALAPYGREFEAPVFVMTGWLQQIKPVGDGTHFKLQVRSSGDGQVYPAIWFSAIAAGESLPVDEGTLATVAYALETNTFRGRTTLQLRIIAVAQ